MRKIITGIFIFLLFGISSVFANTNLPLDTRGPCPAPYEPGACYDDPEYSIGGDGVENEEGEGEKLDGVKNIVITKTLEGKKFQEHTKTFVPSSFDSILPNFSAIYKTTFKDGTTILFDNKLNYCDLSNNSCYKNFCSNSLDSSGYYQCTGGLYGTYMVIDQGDYLLFVYYSDSNGSKQGYISIFSKKYKGFLNLSLRDYHLSYKNNHLSFTSRDGLTVRSFEPVDGKNQVNLYLSFDLSNINSHYYEQYLKYYVKYNIDFEKIDKLGKDYFDNSVFLGYSIFENFYSGYDFQVSSEILSGSKNFYYKVKGNQVSSLYSIINNKYKKNQTSDKKNLYHEKNNFSKIDGISSNYIVKSEFSGDLYQTYVENKNIIKPGYFYNVYFKNGFGIYTDKEKYLKLTFTNNKGLKVRTFGNIFGQYVNDYTLLGFSETAEGKGYLISIYVNGLFDGNGGFKTYYLPKGENGKLIERNGFYYLYPIDGINVVLDKDILKIENLLDVKTNYQTLDNTIFFVGKGNDGKVHFYYKGKDGKIYESDSMFGGYIINGKPFGSQFGVHNLNGNDNGLTTDEEESNKIFEEIKNLLISKLGSIGEVFQFFLVPFPEKKEVYSINIPAFDFGEKNTIKYKNLRADLPNFNFYNNLVSVNVADGDNGVGKKFLSLLLGFLYILIRFFLVLFFLFPFFLYFFITEKITGALFGGFGTDGNNGGNLTKIVSWLYYGSIFVAFSTMILGFFIFVPFFNIGFDYLNNVFGYILYFYLDYDFFYFFVNGFFSILSFGIFSHLAYIFFKNK